MSTGGVTLTRDAKRRTANAVRYVERQEAEGFVDSRGRMRLAQTHYRFELAASPTRDGSKWRWTYSGTAKIKSAAGFDGWVNDPRFSAAVAIRNTFERQNEASGVVSGYDLADPEIIGIEPVEAGLIVDAWWERFVVDGDLIVEWWFAVRNNPIVDCGGGGA